MCHVPLALQCEYGRSDERGKNEDGEDGREWRLSGLLYADNLDLCCELEGGLKVMVGHFIEVCRKCLKPNAGKSKVMVLSGEEGLECKICVDRMQLEEVQEFKYLVCFG